MEWFCIETVDVATNSCSSPGFSSMCASESTVTLCMGVDYPRKNWYSKLVSACYKHQHLWVRELVLNLMLDLDLYCKRVCVTQISLVELYLREPELAVLTKASFGCSILGTLPGVTWLTNLYKSRLVKAGVRSDSVKRLLSRQNNCHFGNVWIALGTF